MTSKCSNANIKVLPNWPYELCWQIPIKIEKMVADPSNGGSDHLESWKTYQHEEITHLCRCWRSSNKPFCDWTHTKNHFNSPETASKAEYQDGATFYKWWWVDLLDKEEYCAVARFCHYWNRTRQDVIDSADPEAKKRAIHSASNCVAGRLTVVDKEWNLIEPNLAPAIWVLQDEWAGRRWPLYVQWGIQIESSDGDNYPVRNRVTLCRCGQSWNMPFCDASHMNCDHMKGFDE